ncbi:MAG: cupin domain-containing protein [Desulfobacteraceae bacterium]|nr:MAG: cupin domain-containing protein [Desulfobacteraceae bacterium]
MKMWMLVIFAVACVSSGCATPKDLRRLTKQQVIDALRLQPMSDEACPGYFRMTYESKTRAALTKDRPAASLIYYMMTPEVTVDPWHIISSDEILLYHSGAPMIMMLLYPDGSWKEAVLGPEADKGHVMQEVIPKNTWMGFVKREDPGYDWGLYGVMVVPGWHIDDIRMAEPPELKELMSRYPQAVPRGRELGLF